MSARLLVPSAGGGFEEQCPATVVVLGNQMMEALNKNYPKWMDGWKVAIDADGGVVQVRNLMISGKMGFIMKMNQIDPEMRNLVRFAGELLERYNLSRNRNIDVVDAVNNLKRNGKGEAQHDE